MYKSSQPKSLDYLLGLRGLAALGVIFGHAFGIGPYSIGVFISKSSGPFLGNIDTPLDPLRATLFCLTPLIGNNFVFLFFVLSGYLMGKVFHDGKYQVSRAGVFKFYKARYFRLAPLLYFNLFIAACFISFADLSLVKLLGDLLFITNFTDRGINLVTWSLSHEMQYYLMAPFVFWVFRKIGYATLLCAIAFIAVVFYVTHHTIFGHFGFLAHFEYLYAFLAGYAVNIAIRLMPIAVTERVKMASIAIGIILINVLYNWLWLKGFLNLATFSVVAVSSTVIFICECPSTYEVSRAHPLLRFAIRGAMQTGTLSYGLYLWHYLIIMTRFSAFTAATDRISAITGWTSLWQKIAIYHAIQIPVVLTASYLLATLTFHLIEVRFRPGLYEPARMADKTDVVAEALRG